MKDVRILLVDDEPLARQRLRQMLADHADGDIVGEAEHVEQALELVRAHRPDLILLDIRMPGADGFAARDVDWIEGSGNYAKLHVGKGTHLIRTTLAELEQDLDPGRFARVHRSAIVSLDRVRELRSLGGGEYRVLLLDGTQVPMSQRYRDRLPDLRHSRLQVDLPAPLLELGRLALHLRGVLAHVLRDLHRAELGPTHRAEVGDFGPFGR
jgi:DNA-binding LytR/AlgR family response regulator